MKYYSEFDYIVNMPFMVFMSLLYIYTSVHFHNKTRSYCLENTNSLDSLENRRKYVKIYNIVQIGLCSYMTYGFYWYFSIYDIFGIGLEEDKTIEFLILVHYLSKYLDWCDTGFMIINKKSSKQMSFLHLYHHSTINLVWGYLLYNNYGNSTVYFGAFLNSFIHILMYTHYLITSFKIVNPFKCILTKMQILQFYMCLLHSFMIMCYYDTPYTGVAAIQFIYQLSMIYLFTFRLHWIPLCLNI